MDDGSHFTVCVELMNKRHFNPQSLKEATDMLHLTSLRQTLYGMGLVVVLTLLVMVGCSPLTSPLSPQTTTGTPRIIQPDQFVPLAVTHPVRPGIATKPVSASKRVPAATGGSVFIVGGEFYEYSLIVPPGALPEDEDMSISVPDDGSAMASLGPHGTRFNTPVTFRISAKVPDTKYGLLKKTLDIYWYNPATGVWEAQDATITKQGSIVTATVQLNHFSQYALGGQ